jgi:hypothetical protein
MDRAESLSKLWLCLLWERLVWAVSRISFN